MTLVVVALAVERIAADYPRRPFHSFEVRMKQIRRFPVNVIVTFVVFGIFCCWGAAIAQQGQDASAHQGARDISEVLRPSPYFVNGEHRGYRVYPGTVPSLFEGLGLQAGDLVTEINGQKLTDPRLAFELFNELAGGKPVELTYERSGKTAVVQAQVK